MGRRAREKNSKNSGEPIGRALEAACGGLIPIGAQVLVACSGGADSTALALGLAQLAKEKPELGLRVSIGHVDHALRSESGREASGVEALAKKLELPFFLEVLDANLLRAAIAREGLEAAARSFRYPALERLAKQAGASLVATAHTRRDQAETVLLRLARGGGLSALAGIRAARPLGPVALIRPLLEVPRAATEALCKSRGFSFTDDPHNRDPKRSRARLRAAFDDLGALLNPRLEEHLAASAKIAAEEDALLESQARAAIVSALETVEPGKNPAASSSPALRVPVLATLPDPILRRAILLVAGPLGARPEQVHLEQLCEQIRKSKGSVDLPFARAEIREGLLRFRIGNARKLPDGPPGPLLIAGPGSYQWGSLIAEISAEPAPDSRAIDRSHAPFPWTLRAIQPGDRFRPANGRSKKVSDLWIDAKVPRSARPSLPLVFDANGALFFVACLRSALPKAGAELSVYLRFRSPEGASFGAPTSLVEQRARNARASIRSPIDEEPR